MAYSRWVNQGDQRYMALAECSEHGPFLVRLKLKKNELELWGASRLIYRADESMVAFYQEKTKTVRRRGRSHTRRKKKKTAESQ